MQHGYLSTGLALVACLGIFGCTQKKFTSEEPLPQPRSECPGIFVLAPAAYMQYIDDEEPVLLASEGRREDLPVYCTEETARLLEARLEADHEIVPGLWQVYQLEGSWEDDVVEVAPGQWRMRRPSRLDPLPQS